MDFTANLIFSDSFFFTRGLPFRSLLGAYHRIYTRADAHVRPHGGAEVIVCSALEAAFQDERAFAVGHRKLVDEVLNVDRDFKDTFSIFETGNTFLPWHPSPYL